MHNDLTIFLLEYNYFICCNISTRFLGIRIHFPFCLNKNLVFIKYIDYYYYLFK